MSDRFNAYLALAEATELLDDGDEDLAEEVRCIMDGIWYSLSDEDQDRLNVRQVGRIPKSARPTPTPKPGEEKP